jgi:YD repeat protein
VSVVTDGFGNIINRYYYTAWGGRVRTDNGEYYHATYLGDEGGDVTDRGYTCHEHLTPLNLIDMNGRIYDPVLARFLSPDPYIQAPDFTQNYNRYAYCLNNPFKYTDPSGENPLIVAAVIGAIVGAYSGGVIANNGQYNPTKWDYSAGKTWGYMLGGAFVGGVSGCLGGAVAASGMPMANTFGLITSSFVNSVGTHIYTGGQTPVSINFGFASYNITNNEWGYLGKKGNKWYENLGYGLGAMANLSDVNQLINSTPATLYTDDSDFISHSAVVDDKGNTLMSYGPNDTKVPNSKLGFATYFRKSTSDYTVYPTLPVEVTVNKHIFTLTRGLGKILPFQGMTTNCVNMASLSLWLNGIPNIGLHPYLLYATTWAYSAGIRPDLFSYYLTNLYRK